MLDELDRELERRGHRFCRYSDDCNIYVRSQRAGERVKRSITLFIERRLKVNEEKSAVARPAERKFLGFSTTSGGEIKRGIASKALTRFKQKARILAGRTRGISIEQMSKELSSYLRGWKGYFGFCQTPSVLEELDQGIRRRLRSVVWKQRKRGTHRYKLLRQRGVIHALAAMAAGSPHGPWRIAKSPAMHMAFPVSYFDSLSIPRLFVWKQLNPPDRRMRTRMYGSVGGEERRLSPYPDFAAKTRGLQPDAARRYGGRSMMRHSQARAGIRATALLAGCVCLAAVAESPNEHQFQALLKHGFELHQQARFAEAIPLLESARLLEPGDYFANLLLGIDLLRTGKATEALPRLELAARTRPGEEIPEDYLGEAEASLGRYAQAAEAYQQAVERGHGSEQAQEAWAGFALERFRQIGMSLRASTPGLATVRRLQQAAANPAAALVCEGSIPALERRLALQQGRPNQASPYMETTYRLSICYAVEAGKAAGQLQAGAEDAAAMHLLRGDILLRLKGDAAGAQEEYGQALALRPGDPALHEHLAEAQLTAGNTEAARESALAALAIDPHRREALRTLASLTMSNRDYAQALPWLRRLAIEAPGDLMVQVQLGKALAQTGNAAEALKSLAPVLAAGYPDEKGALHALEARVLRELGQDADAEKAAAEARRLSDSFQSKNKGGAHERPDADQ